MSPSERERGLGGTGWTPMPSSSSRDHDEEASSLEREVRLIEAALGDRGELRLTELAEASGSRHWGPGRFRRALKEAMRRGVVVAPRRGRYRRDRARHPPQRGQ
jgi:hypothetical protein